MKTLSLITALVAAFMLPFSSFCQDASWYTYFSGTIGQFPFSMHLHKTGHSYTGYYYYDKVGLPIYLTGDDTTAAQHTIMLYGSAASAADGEETFTFSVTTDQLNGEWKKNTDSKGLPLVATAKSPSGILHFDFVYTSGNTLLRPAMKESPAASFQAASIWPKENTALAAYIKKTVLAKFHGKNGQQTIGQLLLANKKAFMSGYIQDNKKTTDLEIAELSYSYNQEEEHRLMVLYQTDQLLTLAKWYYGYMGGAHGNYNTSYYTIDLSRNKELRLPDVFTPAGIKQLDKLVEKYFRKQYNVAAGTSLQEAGLFVDTIKATGNFYATNKGIGFSYAPYEIASFAMGEVRIFIPFSEIGAFINPAFKKLVGQ